MENLHELTFSSLTGKAWFQTGSYKAASLQFQVCEMQVEVSGSENKALGETRGSAWAEEVVAKRPSLGCLGGEHPNPLNVRAWQRCWKLAPPAGLR